MASRKALLDRFAELDAQGGEIPRRNVGQGVVFADTERFYQWATSAMQLIELAFDKQSPHAKGLRAMIEGGGGGMLDDRLKRSIGVFRAARSDFEGGFIESLEVSLSGEVLGDFLGLAKAALDEGHKDVAAVLASAALEDALKRFAVRNGLTVDDKTMQDIVNALKGKGLVGGAQKALLDTMPKLRDYAMHANWEKFTPESVGGMIGFVETFLLTHFS